MNGFKDSYARAVGANSMLHFLDAKLKEGSVPSERPFYRPDHPFQSFLDDAGFKIGKMFFDLTHPNAAREERAEKMLPYLKTLDEEVKKLPTQPQYKEALTDSFYAKQLAAFPKDLERFKKDLKITDQNIETYKAPDRSRTPGAF